MSAAPSSVVRIDGGEILAVTLKEVADYRRACEEIERTTAMWVDEEARPGVICVMTYPVASAPPVALHQFEVCDGLAPVTDRLWAIAGGEG